MQGLQFSQRKRGRQGPAKLPFLMNAHEQLLPTFDPTPIELVRSLGPDDLLRRAVELLQQHEPPEGYYLAFSGGKDSCAIKHLAQLSGVKFDAWYSQTTIDPPELIRFIREHHKDVNWEIPEHGNMMARVAYHGMPTRFVRWCCREYKETGGTGRVCIFGVRAAEIHARFLRWNEVSESQGRPTICPIVYWTDAQLWEFIRQHKIPYCELYDQGFDRIGCVGCPLKNGTPREKNFERWPRFKRNWQEACRKYWEAHKDQILKSGKRNFCGQFKTWQDYWAWWMADKTPDIMREECQTGLLWTNQEFDEETN